MGCCACRHIGAHARSRSASVIAVEQRTLNDLPDEILLNILSHFGPEDLLFVIPQVCDRWKCLAKTVALWKKISYICDRSSDLDGVAKVLTLAPALHSLTVRWRKDAVAIVEILFENHVVLRKLILKNCNLGKDVTGLLDNIVALYPNLEGLSLEGCYPLTPAAYSLIPRLKKLSELDLSNCKGLSGKTVCHIVDSCQHLKKLRLNEVYPIVDGDVIHVIKKLGEQLTALVLDGGALTDVAYSYINNCVRLQELGISYCRKITDRELLEGIGSLRELTSLRLLACPKLTPQALSTFLHRPSMTSIVLLNLSACFNLDDEGLKGIAERCILLKELAVRWCSNVSDAGITMVINNCSQLRVLNFKGLIYITGDRWLPLVPSQLPHLRLLCLEDCDIVCDDHIEELAGAAPQLVVFNRLGEIVGATSNKLWETVYGFGPEYAYVFIREWALDT